MMKRKAKTTRGKTAQTRLAFTQLLLAVLRTATIAVALIATVQAEPRKSSHRENHNYIIERQQAGSVTGVPTLRRIRGSREIDIYPNGMMFEKNNLVGVTRGSR